MEEFFLSLEPLQKLFWSIACVATLIFLIQAILTFIGLGTDTDIDAGPADMDAPTDSMDAGGLHGVFSFRNLVNFLLGYGWAGVLLYDEIHKGWLLQLVAFAIGFMFVLAFVLMFRMLMKLSHDGSFKISDTLGRRAYVYLRIPASRQGRGIVQVSVNGSVHEIDAVTDKAEQIATGGYVTVKEALGEDLLLVE
ncbi:MAG: serine protease [Bacteroidaceae bacterium]|nr:serine protease [Bacteroidaceae bacterium]